MNREDVQSWVEQMRRIQHSLASVILSMGLALEMFDTLSPEEKEHYEQYWQEMQTKTTQDLYQLLDTVEPAASQHRSLPSTKAEESLRQAVAEAFTPEEIVATLRTAWQLAHEQKSARALIAAILPTLEYTLGQPNQAKLTEHSAVRKPLLEALDEMDDN